MLEAHIRDRLGKKPVLLMTHIVLGYPSFEDSWRMIAEMVTAGVDLVELQIPFSEPTADGPTIVRANQQALTDGVTVRQCLDFAGKITTQFDIPFLVMSYYNILFRYGLESFAATAAESGLRGAIIPDLPPEEGQDAFEAMKAHQLAPILIFAPTTPSDRMRYIASCGSGFVYCVARKGVTGEQTDFSSRLARYLARCRQSTNLPLALGFGIKEKADIDFIKGKADIAVIGSRILKEMEQNGISSVGNFIRSLR